MVNSESRWNGIRIRWLQQQVSHGLIQLLWIDGASMEADALTKVLTPAALARARWALMNLCRVYGPLKQVTFSS